MAPTGNATSPKGRQTFEEILGEAIRDFELHGYDNAERMAEWLRRIHDAARAAMVPEHIVTERINEYFRATYKRLIENSQILRKHEGVPRFTLERVKPKLRGELERTIRANADLIKLNREAAVQKTLQRASGWMSSVPAGGTRAVDFKAIKDDLRKPLQQLTFQERRVAIDQNFKFIAGLNRILAHDGGAIAMRWFSHWRDQFYDYRIEHKERDGKIYAIRNSWALQEGLITRCDGYLDEIDQPGEKVFCRCGGVYIYTLRKIKPEFLTRLGVEELARIKAIRQAA